LLPRRLTSAFVAVLVAGGGAWWGHLQGNIAQEPSPYQVISADGTRAMPIARRNGTTDFVALDVLARYFDIIMREDPRADGIVITAGTQRVVLTTGQATVSAGGRLVSLSAPVTRDGTRWLVPIDFLRVLDPLLNRRIDVRRETRLIILDGATVPRITARFDRSPGGGRLTIGVDPAVPARVSRTGTVLTVRFEADALDVVTPADLPADLLSGLKSTGPTLHIDLSPSVTNVRQEDLRDLARITLDLIATPTASARPEGATATLPQAPVIDRRDTIRTVVIDPGHGGSDVGTRTATGLEEKQITLAVAQRLKATLESQLGIRVILTRESDMDVAIDPRAAIANNNKADLFISLHVNSSPVTHLSGWQVQSLDPDDYSSLVAKDTGAPASAQTVPVAGGGTRVIDIVPWQLAQMSHAEQSAMLAELLAAGFVEAGLPSQPVPVLKTPARVLVGANMPAVSIELGFLSHDGDATALVSRAFQGQVADIITGVVNSLRAGWPTPGGGGER